MGAEENKQLVRRFFADAFSKANMDLVETMVAPDMVNNTAPPQLRLGLDGFKTITRMVSAAAPDQEFEILDLIAEGDKVAARVTWRGTFEGRFIGIQGTGEPFAVQHIHIFRLRDGKIAEHWAVRDDLGMMQQTGAISAPGQSG
jgi:steroid delta-isomerase-like uncharacterized protein